jgi:hypothetical protein
MPLPCPTIAELERAREAFGRHEPRDVVYRAATFLVDMAIRGIAPLSLAEAISVLLQTWNRSFYQYRPFDLAHFEALDALLVRHGAWLASARQRSVESYVPEDERLVRDVFTQFETVLGPVGAAKALHLLAPSFFPLWDRRIAGAHGLPLGRTGTNGDRYVRMLSIVKTQSSTLGGASALGRNVLKALDEYNYCHFTKGWL